MTHQPVDPIPAQTLTPGICAVLAERQRQAETLGRDDGHDDALPIGQLAHRAQQRMQDAQDRIRAARDDADWRAARIALVKAAALALATLDRLDRAHPAAQAAPIPYSVPEALTARTMTAESIDRLWEERGWRD